MTALTRAVVAFAAIAAVGTPVLAQVIVPHTSIRSGPAIHPIARQTPLPAAAFAHSAFGKIARFGTGGFVLRLRSGRLLPVDDTAAADAGRVSAPLFVGKLVVVSGTLDPHGTFVAQTVTRMERIDAETRPDH